MEDGGAGTPGKTARAAARGLSARRIPVAPAPAERAPLHVHRRSPPAHGATGRRLAAMLVAAAVVAASLVPAFVVFPPLSDADYMLIDGITYAWHPENPDHPLARVSGMHVNPNHLGFHLAVAALTPLVRALGADAPGFVACRLLSSLGLAAIVLLLVRETGPKRRLLGFALALPLLACHGVILDAAVGETILPACAAALALAFAVTRERPRLAPCALLLAASLVLRQDNVWLAPAAVLAFAWSRPRGARAAAALSSPLKNPRGRAVGLALPAGAAVAAIYLLAWRAHPMDLELHRYLFGIADRGSWSPAGGYGLSPWRLLAGAASWAVAGRAWPMDEPDLAPLAGFALALALPALLLRGRAPLARLAAVVATTVLLRTLFFAWFDPSNWEWWILPFVLAAGLAARAVASPAHVDVAVASPSNRLRHAAALATVALCSAWLVSLHAADTWALRKRTLHDAVGAALAIAGDAPARMCWGDRLGLDLFVRGERVSEIPDQAALPWPLAAGETLDRLLDVLPRAERPVLLLLDRFVRDGALHTRAEPSPFAVLDAREPPPPLVALRDPRGRVYGLLRP